MAKPTSKTPTPAQLSRAGTILARDTSTPAQKAAAARTLGKG